MFICHLLVVSGTLPEGVDKLPIVLCVLFLSVVSAIWYVLLKLQYFLAIVILYM